MPTSKHIRAAEAHEFAARTHRSAMVSHLKGDHEGGLSQAEKASTLSKNALAASLSAHSASRVAVHSPSRTTWLHGSQMSAGGLRTI